MSMKEEEIKDLLPVVMYKGVRFLDINPALHNREAYHTIITRLTDFIREYNPTVIVGIELRGVVFAPVVAYNLKTKLALARKVGGLPRQTYSVTYEYEYAKATLEIQRDALTKGDRVVILDDLIATGGSINACLELIKNFDVNVVAVATVVYITDFANRFADKYKFGGVPILKVLTYDKFEIRNKPLESEHLKS